MYLGLLGEYAKSLFASSPCRQRFFVLLFLRICFYIVSAYTGRISTKTLYISVNNTNRFFLSTLYGIMKPKNHLTLPSFYINTMSSKESFTFSHGWSNYCIKCNFRIMKEFSLQLYVYNSLEYVENLADRSSLCAFINSRSNHSTVQ